MKLKRLILSDVIFLLIIFLLTLLSILSYKRINDLNAQSKKVSQTNLIKYRLQQVLTLVKSAESGQRGFLLTGDSVHLQPYFESAETQKLLLNEIDTLVSIEQQRSFNQLKWLISTRLKRLSGSMDSAHLQPVTSEMLIEGKAVMDQVEKSVDKMIKEEDRSMMGHTTKEYAAYITPLYSLLLSVFAIITVAIAYFILRTETRLRFHAQDSIRKLNDYFKDMPAAFSILKGPYHVHEMANKVYYDLTGNRSLIGRPFREAMPEMEGQGIFEIIDNVYNTGEAFIGKESPILIERKEGELVKGYYNLICEPLFNKSSKVEGIMIFGYDITEMIEARNKVKDTEQRSRLAIEAANIGTFDWDMENEVFVSSQRLIEIFGFKGQDVSHKVLINTFHPDDKPIRDKAVAESMQSGSLAYEVRIIWQDGSIHWVNVYGKVIQLDANTLHRMYGTVLDVTVQKSAMEELVKSEAQFRLLSDSIPQFIWTTDPVGTPSYFSKATVDYSGLSFEALVENGLFQLAHPDERQQNLRSWGQAIQSGGEFQLEHRLVNAAGEYRWHLSRAIPQKDEKGNILRWVGSSTDIQGQKDLNQKLEQQIRERTKELDLLNKELLIKNNIFEQAEENALIGSYSWNLQTGSLEYSDNLFRLFGFQPGEFVPTFERYLSLIHPDDKAQVEQDGIETMETKMLVEHTYRIITKQGQIKHFRSTGKLIGEEPNLIMIGTVQDISQDKHYNEVLQAKNLELERSNTELESFNYIASHDLQEPLRKIQAFSQRILSKEGEHFSAFSKDYFSRIHAAAARMQNLIDALLSYSRSSATNLQAEEINLNELLDEVVIDMQDMIEEKNVQVSYNDLPVIRVVPIQVHQLFTNLISNAIKYSRNGIPPEIIISAKAVVGKDIDKNNVDLKAHYWQISVADNGIGFEQQYEHKIFELFQRLHGSTDYIGTGIGLAICKKIIRNHQGYISATGHPGKGAIFNIYFPIF